VDVQELGHIDAEFFALVDELFVDKAMRHVEATCDPLHVAAGNFLGGRPAFGASAFKGMSGHQGGWIPGQSAGFVLVAT
jgi:hypothetical protein